MQIKTILKNKLNEKLFYNEASYFLNIKNIEVITKKKIDYYNKKFNTKKDLWEKYKVDVFFDWDYNNREFTTSYISRVKKLVKKLELKLNKEQEHYISDLVIKEFTSNRSIKIIESPFLDDDKIYTNENVSHFIYTHVNLLETKKGGSILEQITLSDLYMTKKRIVFWSKPQKKITFEISLEDIKEINQLKYGVEIIAKNNSYILRYKDLDSLYISFKRLYKVYNNISFKVKSKRNYKSSILDIFN